MKVLLRPDTPSSADYVRLLHQALQGALPSASDSDVSAVRLRTGLAAICSRINEQAPLPDIEGAITAAGDLLRKYQTAGSQRALEQLSELKAVMRTMTDTIAFLSESRSTVVHQLTYVERQLEEAADLDDIRLLRPRLAECLELVRQETARLQAESSAHSEAVRQQMGIAPAAAPAVRRLGSIDLATGLPNRAAAERLLAEKVGAGQHCSLALFVPERLGFVTRRHGQGGENEVLLHVAQHIAKLMPQGAWLYRWTGPALLAVRISRNSMDDEQLWAQIASKHVEKTITTERRSALVRITLASLVRQADLSTPLDCIFSEFEAFIAQNTRE